MESLKEMKQKKDIQARLNLLAQQKDTYLIMEKDQVADHLYQITKREFSFAGQPDRKHVDENYLETLRNSEFGLIYSYFTGLDKEEQTARFWEWYLKVKENEVTPKVARQYRGAVMRNVWTWLINYYFAKAFGYLTEEQSSELYNYTTQISDILYEAKGHRETIPDPLKTIPDIDFTDYTRHNYYAEVMAVLFYYALVFPEAPNSVKYFEYAMQETENLMKSAVYDGGAWHESPRYAGAVLRIWVPLFQDLKRLMGCDLFQMDGFRSMLDYFVKTQTPAYLEREAGLSAERAGCFVGRSPALGDSIWSTDWYVFLAYAACGYQETDPEFAGNLMYAWQQAGSPYLSARIKETFTVGNFDPDITPVPVADKSFVVSWKKGNAILQYDRYGEDGKWLCFRCGADSLTPTPLSSHQHADKNSFSLFAYGYPMLLDPGVGEYEEAETEFYRSAPAHNLVDFAKFIRPGLAFVKAYGSLQTQFTTTRGEMIKFETNEQFDLVIGKVLKSGWEETAGSLAPGGTYEYTRSIFFAKPDYFVIRDVIGDDTEADLIFNGPGDLEIVRDGAVFYQAQKEVGLRVIILPLSDYSVESRIIPFAAISQWADNLKSLKITSQNPGNSGFLTVLFPFKGTDPDIMASYEPISNQINITYGKICDVITFNDDTYEWSRGSLV